MDGDEVVGERNSPLIDTFSGDHKVPRRQRLGNGESQRRKPPHEITIEAPQGGGTGGHLGNPPRHGAFTLSPAVRATTQQPHQHRFQKVRRKGVRKDGEEDGEHQQQLMSKPAASMDKDNDHPSHEQQREGVGSDKSPALQFDVTHGVFVARFGLVANLEYLGEHFFVGATRKVVMWGIITQVRD